MPPRLPPGSAGPRAVQPQEGMGQKVPGVLPGGGSPDAAFPAASALFPGSAALVGLPLTEYGPGKEGLSASLALSQAFRRKRASGQGTPDT